MSDDPTETTAEEVEVDSPEVETPDEPGDDLGALRRALEHEREERKTAKEELRRWREDGEYRNERLAELGYTFDTDDELDDDEDEPEPDRPVEDPRVDVLLEREAQRQFDTDFATFTAERAVDKDAKEWITARAHAIGAASQNGFGPESLEKAVKEFYVFEDRLGETYLERVKTGKKAPKTPVRGTPATEVPDLDDRNARRAWMAEKAAQLAQQ